MCYSWGPLARFSQSIFNPFLRMLFIIGSMETEQLLHFCFFSNFSFLFSQNTSSEKSHPHFCDAAFTRLFTSISRKDDDYMCFARGCGVACTSPKIKQPFEVVKASDRETCAKGSHVSPEGGLGADPF